MLVYNDIFARNNSPNPTTNTRFMKDKILAALREKYKSKGFSEEALQKIAAYLEKTVTEEGQVDASVSGVEDLLTGFQGEIDKRVATALAKPKDKPADPPKPTDDPAKPADDTPAWLKTLNETVTNLANEVTSLKQGKTIESRRSQLETALKDAPEAFKTTTLRAFDRGITIKDDADFDTYLGEIKTDAAAAIQSAADSGLNAMGQPRKSAGGDTTKPASKEELDSAMKSIPV